MKIRNLLSALLFGAMMSSAQNGASIEYKMSSSKGAAGNLSVKYSEFGSRSEMNMKSPMPMMMTTLQKKDAPDVIYIINDANKSYSEMKKGQNASDDNHTYTVKKIGTETVAGYKCVHSMVTNENNATTEMWTTKDITDYSKYAESINSNRKMGSQKRENAMKEAGCEGFPVKMISKNNEREGDMTMELTKFEKKNFSKSDFEIPAGYSKSGGPGTPASGMPAGIKSQEELMKMTPEERAKYAEELKKQYGKGN